MHLHGGGPCISREGKDIDAKIGFGILESAYKVFSFMLMAHAKQHYEVVLTKKLSQAEGIRAVLYQEQLDKLKAALREADPISDQAERDAKLVECEGSLKTLKV